MRESSSSWGPPGALPGLIRPGVSLCVSGAIPGLIRPGSLVGVKLRRAPTKGAEGGAEPPEIVLGVVLDVRSGHAMVARPSSWAEAPRVRRPRLDDLLLDLAIEGNAHRALHWLVQRKVAADPTACFPREHMVTLRFSSHVASWVLETPMLSIPVLARTDILDWREALFHCVLAECGTGGM